MDLAVRVILAEGSRLKRSHTSAWFLVRLPRYNIWARFIIHCIGAHGHALQRTRFSLIFAGLPIVYTVQLKWVPFVRRCVASTRHCCPHSPHSGPGISTLKKGSYADQSESDLLEQTW